MSLPIHPEQPGALTPQIPLLIHDPFIPRVHPERPFLIPPHHFFSLLLIFPVAVLHALADEVNKLEKAELTLSVEDTQLCRPHRECR